MKQKVILVTGGAGFIGSHTVVELMAAGFDVVIADDFSNAHEEVIDGIATIAGRRPEVRVIDLCDTQATHDLFDKIRPQAIVHFAAKKLVGESVEKPLVYYKNNLDALMNVAGAAIEFGCNNIVFSSSCTVYG